LRSGAGLVRVAVPDASRVTVASADPCYMTVPLPSDDDGHIALLAKKALGEHLDRSTVVACGPGLGRSAELDELVSWLYRELKKPLVVDADALNALADHPDVLAQPGGPRILTPHPGEFARLNRIAALHPQDRQPLARQFASQCKSVVVLKGHGTVITDGDRVAINATGNPGMSTGGTGDVLTGVITALLGQGLAPFDAAYLGAHAHGLAGDLAAEEFGQVGMTARDLINYLPYAWQRLQ
jgi:ADP-dependent NAD(P)H-hydrate dehydratase